jgi:predicted MFS family arabinose efflux permease
VIDGDGKTSYREAFAAREFRFFFAAGLISLAGSTVSAVALTVLVYQRTSSPFLSSLTFALAFLPYLFSGLLASALVDRLPPRRLLISCDVGSACFVAPMAWPGTPIPVLLILLLCASTLTGIGGGARAGLVRVVVSDQAYVAARSALRISGQAAQLAGNAVGGALLIVVSPSAAILINACSFLVSATLTRVGLERRPAASSEAEHSLVRDSLAALRSVFGHSELRRLLLLTWLVPTFAVAPEAVAAPYVSAIGGSAAQVGWWLLALPVGMVAGDLLGVWFLTNAQQRRIVAVASGATFVPLLAFVFHPSFLVAFALLIACGGCFVSSLGLDLRVRDAAPLELFARAMAINSAGLIALQGLGFALAGAIAEAVGPADAIAVSGVAGLAVVVVLTFPRFRRREEVGQADGAMEHP